MKREALSRIQVEENADEDDGHSHVHLMLGEHASGVFLSLQWKRKDVGREMDVGKITDTARNLAISWNMVH